MKRLYAATRRVAGYERCELCAAPIEAAHDHLYEPHAREVRCACKGCAMIIPTSQLGRYRLVPRRFERLALDVATWLPKLGVPVGVAAVIPRDFGDGVSRAVVAFPGPAGLVECEIDEPLWQQLGAAMPAIAAMQPEIEALVCSTLGSPAGIAGPGAWIAGIDVVFEMIGALRSSWRGMSGGPEVPAALARVIAAHAGGAA